MGEALFGIVGGVLGVVGTLVVQLLANATQKESQHRMELLPVASRALNAAQESWEMLRAHAISTGRGDHSAAGDYLVRYTEAYQRLTMALDELSLLVRPIGPETEKLREALALGTLLPGDQHIEQKKAYDGACEALKERLRRFLKT